MVAEAVRGSHGSIIHAEDGGIICAVDRGDDLQAAAVIAAGAYHAGYRSGHIIAGAVKARFVSAHQIGQRAGEPGASGYSAAAERRQLTGKLLYVHTHQIADGGGAQEPLLAQPLNLAVRIQREGADYPVRPAAGNAHCSFIDT